MPPIGFHPIEILILLAVGLLIFAPKKLPQITSGIAKGLKGFKKELTDKKPEAEQKEIEQ
ncbi:MAG TPA: twin-arginine translocase TatA/TatE family subunit [Ktedonosporobacter sp.]|nr:twin-arginine translocase TatA/TatE family subunit [Ktedonosporobacter sp.]